MGSVEREDERINRKAEPDRENLCFGYLGPEKNKTISFERNFKTITFFQLWYT